MNLPHSISSLANDLTTRIPDRLSSICALISPILIFDEATSALDNESEQIVQESLEKLAKNRTTFVIAHRLTTIENAEEIFMLTDEGIKERGTHKELMELDGEYAHMVKIHSAN